MKRKFSKIDVLVYGDFNKERDLKYKAYGAYQYIKILQSNGILGRVICRNESGCNWNFFSAIPFGSLIPKLLTYLQFKLGIETRNFSQNFLFDFFASRKIRSKIVLSFVQGLKRCAKKVRKEKGVYIEVSTTENMQVFLDKLQKECEKFGLSVNRQIRKIFLNGIETSKEADYIIAISEHAKETYLEKGFDNEKVFVIPQVVNTSKYNPSQKTVKREKFKVLCVAHFQILKGLHYLIKAWRELELANAELVIVGNIDKNSRIAVEKFVGSPNSVKNIVFVGSVADALEYYQNCDVFVFPSLCEGYGRAVAEAMSCAMPVIVTDSCGVKVRNAIDGFVVETKNVRQLKEKINFYYLNRNKISEMGKNARERIKEICDEVKRKEKIRNLLKIF